MAKKQLEYDRDDFRDQLVERINLGNQLLQLPIFTASFQDPYNNPMVLFDPNAGGALQELKDKFSEWDSYNCELLRQAFSEPDNDEFKIYDACSEILLYTTNERYAITMHTVITNKIKCLVNLKNKLNLIPVNPALNTVQSAQQTPVSGDKRSIFVVHGHDENLRKSVELLIRKLGYDPIVLFKEPDGGNTIIEKFEKYACKAVFAIVIYSYCDDGKDKNSTDLERRARQNVVFEHGYMMSRLGRGRVVALLEDNVVQPGDLSGVIYKHIDPTGQWRFEIAKEMRAAGLQADANLIK